MQNGPTSPGLAPDEGRPPKPTFWILFSYLSIWSYVLYGLGNALPYLRADLRLSDFEAGLHSSALAVGILSAGVCTDWVVRVVGRRWLMDVAVASLVISLGLVVLAPGLPVSLTGAVLMGFGGGTLVVDVNLRLGKSGGLEARRLLSQANALSMAAAVLAPLAIGLAASGLHAWKIALLVPVVALLGLTLRPRESEATGGAQQSSSPLPAAYWFTWLLLTLSVAIEFSFVFWGSTVVQKRTGVSGDEATVLASLFVVGMLVGRTAIGRGFGAGRASHLMLGAGLGVAMVGAILLWVSPTPALSGLALLVGGIGVAGLWPVGLSVALQTAPEAQVKAAARVTLAAGCAALLAPSGLGLAADNVGVVTAWLIVVAMVAGAMAVLAVTPRAR